MPGTPQNPGSQDPSFSAPDPTAGEAKRGEFDLRAQMEGIGEAAKALTENPNQEAQTDLYTRSNNFADQLSAQLESLSPEERDKMLLDITGRLAASIMPLAKGTADESIQDPLSYAVHTIVGRYDYMLDPAALPGDSLLQLTELSVFSSGSVVTPELVETVYNRFANDLYGPNAPDFTKDPSFTRILLNRFMSKEIAADEDADPEKLMLAGGEATHATELHLMANGFSGPEASRIITLWGTVKSSEPGQARELRSDLLENIQRIGAVNKKRPGIAPRLYKQRGVAHFGRYSERLLLQQFEPLPEGVEPDFMLLAQDDHNGAFSHTVNTIEASLDDEAAGGIRIAEVDSPEDLLNQASLLTGQFGPAANLIIGGHGNADSVKFGPEYVDRPRRDVRLEIDRVKEQLHGLVQFVKPNGSILLVSCTTGAEGGIAEAVAGFLDRQVQAPTDPSNIANVRYTEDGRLIAEFGGGTGRDIVPENNTPQSD